MFQYELRIQRRFKCPKCGRTVLTRGAVVSRSCTCSEPAPFMQMIDTPRVLPFDPSAFATYNNEEDATPTDEELVEELPAHMMPPAIEQSDEPPPPRRGKGYLRAEVSPESDVDSNSLDVVSDHADSFGDGLDPEDDTPSHVATDVVQAGATSQQVDTSIVAENVAGEDSAPSEKRRSRRRRKRKPRNVRGTPSVDSGLATSAKPSPQPQGRAEQSGAEQPRAEQPRAEQPRAEQPDADQSESVPVPASPTSSDATASDTQSGSSENSSDAGRKRKRRRRRRGK